MTGITFWQLFRLIFVLFSMFLMGDAFYRWDGFSYYASFAEFIPAVALVFIQCSLVTVIFTIILWLALKLLYYVCTLFGFKIEFDHLLQYSGIFVFLAAVIWAGKQIALPLQQTPLLIKLIILIAAAFASLMFVKIFSDLFSRFFQILQERITPIVWLFGALVFLSIPIVSYHTWLKGPEKSALERSVTHHESVKNMPNIILVTFDAMTTRDMSLYGYHRETTPFITEWAKGASLFTRLEASSTFTTPTTASLMTGKRLWSHLAWYQASPIRNKKSENIAHELRKDGYYTMAYIGNPNAAPETLGIAGDFDKTIYLPANKGFLHNFHTTLSYIFHGKIRLYDWILLEDFYPTILFRKYIYDQIFMPIYTKIFSGKRDAFDRDNTPLDKFISDFNNEAPPEPFFVWIHVFPPHSPYFPPESFQGMFEPSQRLRGADEQDETLKQIKGYFKKGLTITKGDVQDIKTLRARYNEHILFCDKEFEDFIENLKTKNLLEDSLVILSADHGEIFEHNSLMHEEVPYEPVVHIPLIIKEPNQREGKIFNNLIEQIDIPATIMDFSGVSGPSWLEGRSLMPLIHGNFFPQSPAFAMHLQRSQSHQIAHGFISVYEGDYKLIYYIDENRSLLFNLKEDPDEMNNLFLKEPETGRRLLAFLKDHLKKANERIKGTN